jgi:uncharacterized membrane protein YhaH (DUF805 family)
LLLSRIKVTQEVAMGFGEAISSGFSNYVNFSGRTQRSGYWFWTLFVCILSVVASILDMVVAAAIGFSFVSVLLLLAIFIPGVAVSVRRMHDLDKSGWWLLIAFIPIIGAIMLLIWFCSAGTPGVNRFGPDPLGVR